MKWICKQNKIFWYRVEVVPYGRGLAAAANQKTLLARVRDFTPQAAAGEQTFSHEKLGYRTLL